MGSDAAFVTRHSLPFSEEKNMDQLEPRAKAMDNQCAGHEKKKTHCRRVRQKEKIQEDEAVRSKSTENELY